MPWSYSDEPKERTPGIAFPLPRSEPIQWNVSLEELGTGQPKTWCRTATRETFFGFLYLGPLVIAAGIALARFTSSGEAGSRDPFGGNEAFVVFFFLMAALSILFFLMARHIRCQLTIGNRNVSVMMSVLGSVKQQWTEPLANYKGLLLDTFIDEDHHMVCAQIELHHRNPERSVILRRWDLGFATEEVKRNSYGGGEFRPDWEACAQALHLRPIEKDLQGKVTTHSRKELGLTIEDKEKRPWDRANPPSDLEVEDRGEVLSVVTDRPALTGRPVRRMYIGPLAVASCFFLLVLANILLDYVGLIGAGIVLALGVLAILLVPGIRRLRTAQTRVLVAPESLTIQRCNKSGRIHATRTFPLHEFEDARVEESSHDLILVGHTGSMTIPFNSERAAKWVLAALFAIAAQTPEASVEPPATERSDRRKGDASKPRGMEPDTAPHASRGFWERVFHHFRERILPVAQLALGGLALICGVVFWGWSAPTVILMAWLELPILFLFSVLRTCVNRKRRYEVCMDGSVREVVQTRVYFGMVFYVLIALVYVARFFALQEDPRQVESLSAALSPSLLGSVGTLFLPTAGSFVSHIIRGRYKTESKGEGPEALPLVLHPYAIIFATNAWMLLWPVLEEFQWSAATFFVFIFVLERTVLSVMFLVSVAKAAELKEDYGVSKGILEQRVYQAIFTGRRALLRTLLRGGRTGSAPPPANAGGRWTFIPRFRNTLGVIWCVMFVAALPCLLFGTTSEREWIAQGTLNLMARNFAEDRWHFELPPSISRAVARDLESGQELEEPREYSFKRSGYLFTLQLTLDQRFSCTAHYEGRSPCRDFSASGAVRATPKRESFNDRPLPQTGQVDNRVLDFERFRQNDQQSVQAYFSSAGESPGRAGYPPSFQTTGQCAYSRVPTPKSSRKPSGARKKPNRTARHSAVSHLKGVGAAERILFSSKDFERATTRHQTFWVTETACQAIC